MAFDAAPVNVMGSWRGPANWSKAADFIAVLVALSLPWSTSLLAIFVVVWILAVIPTIEWNEFGESLRRPICLLPISFVVLAIAGTLWSSAPWAERLHGINPTVKLLVLPVLFYHFERSTRGMWVAAAFLLSCTLLLIMSWVVVFYPQLALKSDAFYGVPVKNYIDQSQEFTLCAVVLLYPVCEFARRSKLLAAALLAFLAANFLVNMLFVVVARTSLVAMPIMLVVAAFLNLKLRDFVIAVGLVAVVAALAWFASPQLRARVQSVDSEYSQYEKTDEATSVGLRLEFWRKSVRLLAEAPFFGHGTGSTRSLFERAAANQVDAASVVIGNPHNQTLNNAVQWGALGILVLYAMWLVHLLQFRGSGIVPWIGLLVVVQNMITSVFNSHLFDFNQGWIYVLGVGIAGGMVQREKWLTASLYPPERSRVGA